MIYYANEKSQYIQHYGVPGMKWGRHKYISNINRKIQPSDKAWGNMYKAKLKKEKRESENANKAYKKAKKAYKISKKYEKQQMKDIKTKYRNSYLSGKSTVGKVISKIIGSDKIYADTMYDMHKRSKVNKIWKD